MAMIADDMTTFEASRIALPSDDYERLERVVARALCSPLKRPLARRLAAELDGADIVDHRQLDATVVTMNAGVCFRDEGNAQERCVRLVYPGDEIGNPRRVSVISPLGVALIGRREGDSTVWEDEQGYRRRTAILKVLAFRSDDE